MFQKKHPPAYLQRPNDTQTDASITLPGGSIICFSDYSISEKEMQECISAKIGLYGNDAKSFFAKKLSALSKNLKKRG